MAVYEAPTACLTARPKLTNKRVVSQYHNQGAKTTWGFLGGSVSWPGSEAVAKKIRCKPQ